MIKNSNTKTIESYNLSDFKDDNNFVKIAYVHTFFRTEFQINSTLMQRTGKAIGRDIEFVSDEVLKSQLNKEASLAGIKDQIKDISMNLLEDYSKPVSCKPALAPNPNFNLIKEGDELNFNCNFSIGRFVVEYNKTYIFDDQYINNNCR